MTDWHTEPPPKCGYYLGAWQRGAPFPHWIVSELWYNPPNGWWSGRGYFGQRNDIESIKVAAWTEIPQYKDET